MSIEQWGEVWKYVLLIGCGAFFVLGLAVIPLGLRDVFRLFKKLGVGGEADKNTEKPTEN